MKALVLKEVGKLELLEAEKPRPGPDELLIRTKAATICTSDINDIHSNVFQIALPMIMGHEGAGIVEEVGENVKGFAPGDAVCTHPVIPCNSCASCRRGLYHLCDDMTHLGINLGGVFAEYYVIRQDRARKKPKGIDFPTATLLEPVSVCLEALERAQVAEGKRVLILGDGPFGILMSRLCTRYRPKQIILLGRHPFRMGYAMPGVAAIDERITPDAEREILRQTGGEGVDCAILCVGTNEAVNQAVSVLRSRGCLSVFSGVTGNPTIDLFKIHVKELTVAGSCNDENLMDEALASLRDPELALPDMITHTFSLEDYEKAFALAEHGKDEALKVSFVF